MGWERGKVIAVHRFVRGPYWRCFSAVVALLALGATDCGASTVQVQGGVLVYQASPGVANTVSITGPNCYSVLQVPCTDADFFFLIDENGAPFFRPPGETITSVGPECAQSVPSGPTGTQYQSFCRAAAINAVDIRLGDGDDWYDGTGVKVPMTIRAAEGNDDVRDGAGNDTIYGGPGADSISAKAGNDLALGEGGDDTYHGLFCSRPDPPPGSTDPPGPITCDQSTDSAKDSGNDTFIGGDGTDTADFHDVSRDQTLSVDDQANDGKQGEKDNIDVEDILGGPRNDTLVGNDSSNLLDGGAGDDTLDGGRGADTLRGDAGTDTVDFSRRSADVTVSLDNVANDGQASEKDNALGIENVSGGLGSDTITGNDGPNRLLGGAGEDFLDGLAGTDQLLAGEGIDLVRTRDGARDGTINCGAGHDFVIADPSERGDSDCELVDRTPSDRPVAGGVVAVATGGEFGLRLRDAHRYIALRDHVNIPVGSAVDATRSPVRLVFLQRNSRVVGKRGMRKKSGGRFPGTFVGGVFRLHQLTARSPAQIALKGGNPTACGGSASSRAGQIPHLRDNKLQRRIHARVRGHYVVSGHYSATAVVGTNFTVADYCDGTRTSVTEGTVRVRDFGKRRTVFVRAGTSYFARAK